jgi:hypothetical protein
MPVVAIIITGEDKGFVVSLITRLVVSSRKGLTRGTKEYATGSLGGGFDSESPRNGRSVQDIVLMRACS